MITVVIVEAADEHLREIGEWWMARREANPLLLIDEFDRCVRLLESSPALGRASTAAAYRVCAGCS